MNVCACCYNHKGTTTIPACVRACVRARERVRARVDVHGGAIYRRAKGVDGSNLIVSPVTVKLSNQMIGQAASCVSAWSLENLVC